jgi:hypothetical protein
VTRLSGLRGSNSVLSRKFMAYVQPVKLGLCFRTRIDRRFGDFFIGLQEFFIRKLSVARNSPALRSSMRGGRDLPPIPLPSECSRFFGRCDKWTVPQSDLSSIRKWRDSCH